MHYFSVFTLASIATAIPLDLVTRQLDRTSTTENEFSLSLRCAKVVFVWARGSTEMGNMVILCKLGALTRLIPEM